MADLQRYIDGYAVVSLDTEPESMIEDAVAFAHYCGREDAARVIEAARRFWTEHYQGRDVDEEEFERVESA